MIVEVYERLGLGDQGEMPLRVVLTHEQRDRGRLKVQSVDGAEVRIFVERGQPLRVGETLRGRCGRLVLVEGATEPVLHAQCSDWETFSRACYHLGNRHVKVQLGHAHDGGRLMPWLRILPDHVLEAMLQQLGMQVVEESAVFVPEGGAYGHGHPHAH